MIISTQTRHHHAGRRCTVILPIVKLSDLQNGVIDMHELRVAFGEVDAPEFLNEADTNGDGVMDYEVPTSLRPWFVL